MIASARHRPHIVLVATDDAAYEALVREALEQEGIHVETAASGRAVLSAFHALRPDLILIDGSRPRDFDGNHLCTALRRHPAGRDTPIVMATGYDDLGAVDAAYDVDATDFLPRQVDMGTLVHRVRFLMRANGRFRRHKDRQHRLGEAQRIAALGTFVWPVGSKAVECSAELSRLLGLGDTATQLSFATLVKRLQAKDRARLFIATRGALLHRNTINLDLGVVASDGAPGCISVRAEVGAGDRGDLFVHGTVQDITDRKRIETELQIARDTAQSASVAKTSFLANMSHELRTPLNAIIGFSEIIAHQAFGPDAQPRYREYAGDILSAGRHMLDVVNDILTMAKLESGHIDLSLEAVDLRQVIERSVLMFGGTTMARGRDITIVPEGPWPTLSVDEHACRRMVLNLLSNAAKFSEDTTRIEIRCDEMPSGDISLSVIDQGIGMTAAEIDLAVEPFRQIDSRLARRYEGTGLGLSIVKKLIERHGGRLAIDSTPEVGTTVKLIFPATLLSTLSLEIAS